MMSETDGKYDDMIELRYPASNGRARMSRRERAAQFAPFAALTGYGDAVKETGRLTDTKLELDEDAEYILDCKLRLLLDSELEIRAAIRYFIPDTRKRGGSYAEAVGIVERLDEVGRAIILKDKTRIPIECIREIEFVRDDRISSEP